MSVFYLVGFLVGVVSSEKNWEFGMDSGSYHVISQEAGRIRAMERHRTIQLSTPPCQDVKYILVEINNPLATPAVTYNKNTQTVTISYSLLQSSLSTYDVTARGRTRGNCNHGYIVTERNVLNGPAASTEVYPEGNPEGGVDQGDVYQEQNGGVYQEQNGDVYQEQNGDVYQEQNGGSYQEQNSDVHQGQNGGGYQAQNGGGYQEQNGYVYLEQKGNVYPENGGVYLEQNGGSYQEQDGYQSGYHDGYQVTADVLPGMPEGFPEGLNNGEPIMIAPENELKQLMFNQGGRWWGRGSQSSSSQFNG